MSSSTSFQDFIANIYPRRLLLHNPLHQPPTTSPAPAPGNSGNDSFAVHIILILSILICALICSLVLNSIIRCALRSFSFVAFVSGGNPPNKLAINTGIKQKALRTFPIVKYTPELKLPGLGTGCVICLSEFELGERVRLLPKCNHGFHVKCIDKWLRSHSSCPTCRHNLVETCQKIVDCNQASSSELPPPVQESIVNIVPLEPESSIRNYRGIS